jgi:DNA repair exonuclease SbcCD ATPase subunit
MLLKLDALLKQAKEDLLPLKNNKESIEYKLTVGTEYKKELAEYRDMYQKIETLKYYSSPTTGIQMVFINMYLSKILDNANRLLAGLFNGIFALLPLVITESEFRIPVAVNGGINHDDITSMSSAQISLISMIISIAMLSQTSTRLNIIVGDEIDAPFDSENRRGFINILYQLMSLVNSSQCVLISHNSEIPMNDCDIILLRHENDIITEGNVIWSYN